MSWLPFRKPSKKDKEQLVDVGFESQTDVFNKVEANTKKSYKDVKRHVENSQNLIKAQQRFANELSLIDTNEQLNATSGHMQTAFTRQVELQQELNANLRKLFVDPMKKFSGNFNNVNNTMKRREQSYADYKKYLNRRDKLREKSETQSGRYDANERYLTLAKADFDRRNKQLNDDLPNFYDCRLAYFRPCFEGLVRSQFEYIEKSRVIFEELGVKMDCPLEQWTEEEYKEETSKRLADIKSLSIVA